MHGIECEALQHGLCMSRNDMGGMSVCFVHARPPSCSSCPRLAGTAGLAVASLPFCWMRKVGSSGPCSPFVGTGIPCFGCASSGAVRARASASKHSLSCQHACTCRGPFPAPPCKHCACKIYVFDPCCRWPQLFSAALAQPRSPDCGARTVGWQQWSPDFGGVPASPCVHAGPRAALHRRRGQPPPGACLPQLAV